MSMALSLRITRTSGSLSLKNFTVKVREAKASRLGKVSSKKTTWTSMSSENPTGAEAIDGVHLIVTKSDKGPTFWSIDLKEVMVLKNVKMLLKKEYYINDKNLYTDMKILTNRWGFEKNLLTMPPRWSVCKELGEILTKHFAKDDHDDRLHVEETCDKRTEARTVRIQNPAGQSLYLREVEIYENAMWFRPPYDCYDTLTSKFGCKDLKFNLFDSTVTKGAASGQETRHKGTKEGGYFTVKSRMLDADLFAGHNRQDRRIRVARLLTVLNNNGEFKRERKRSKGTNLQWNIVKKEGAGTSESGNDYYQIISMDTKRPLYALPDVDVYTWHYDVYVGNNPYTDQGDRALWEFLKQSDGYYMIMNKGHGTPLFATMEGLSYAKVADPNRKFTYNGKETWDLARHEAM